MAVSSYAGLLRLVRRYADFSQRQLAEASGVSQSTVALIESGKAKPSARIIEQLLAAAGFEMTFICADAPSTFFTPDDTWQDFDAVRDAGNRNYPAHLDARRPTHERPWWFWYRDTTGTEGPVLTFGVRRDQRDRWRSEDGRDASQPDDRSHRNEPPSEH